MPGTSWAFARSWFGYREVDKPSLERRQPGSRAERLAVCVLRGVRVPRRRWLQFPLFADGEVGLFRHSKIKRLAHQQRRTTSFVAIAPHGAPASCISMRL